MRPVFADPKTDFVFKRIFGSEVHKPLLIELLNALQDELDLYDRAKIAEQDARGALSLARSEEAARALLTVLRARGIAVPDAVRERILAQRDAERLERWLEKAAVAASVAEVIDETG